MDSEQLENCLMFPSEIFIMNWMQGAFVCWLDNCILSIFFSLHSSVSVYIYFFLFNLAGFLKLSLIKSSKKRNPLKLQI